MKGSIGGVCFLAAVSLLLFSACKKDGDSQQGYHLITAYKNALSVPVTIQYGFRLKRQPNKEDTTAFVIPGITIDPGQTYETSVFICTANCGPEILSESDPRYQKTLAKVTINGKGKIDTLCGLYYAFFPDAARKLFCESDEANIFNDGQWVKTKNAAGNITKREYLIDEADRAEVR